VLIPELLSHQNHWDANSGQQAGERKFDPLLFVLEVADAGAIEKGL
jgi:hypothetical protein